MTNERGDAEAMRDSGDGRFPARSRTEGNPDYAVGALEALVRKIADGQAIVYVGAGVSQSAGLPSWLVLLEKLQEEASNRLKNQEEPAQEYFETLKKRSRNLELGDWLLRLLGPEFQQVISNSLSEGEDLCAIAPSPIHWNILRSPFKMAITTNYDLILEKAYDDAYHACPVKLPYLTWKHTDEILRAATGKSFRIVHAHGTVGDSNSIVLSGSQYTMLHNARPRFEEVLKQFLKNYTFLFVGAGLEDPDLIYILQEAIAENAGVVGPHYALLPYTEAPQIRRDILRDSLHIEVIPVGSADFVKKWEALQDGEESPRKRRTHWMTPAASSILRALAGRVARRRFRMGIPGSPTSDDPGFCLDLALVALLRQAIEATGSFRGDICLSPDGIDSHLSGVLQYAYNEGATTGEVVRKNVDPNSICGIAYHEADTRRGVYVKDVTSRDLAAQIGDPRLIHYGDIRYVSGDSRVRSELAIPIEADGVRVGVLNLESNLAEAYGKDKRETEDFRKVSRLFAEKAGRLYAAVHDRDRRSARLDGASNKDVYKSLRDLCARLWHLARGSTPPSGGVDPAQNMALLVYRASYRKGDLVSQNPVTTVLLERSANGQTVPLDVQRFPFAGIKENERSRFLATRVFLEGRPYYYPDVCYAIKAGKIQNRHCRALGLSRYVDENGKVPPGLDLKNHKPEPIIGFPVLIHGRAAGVVVVWNYRASGTRVNLSDNLDSRDIEIFRRATHLMANHFDWSRRLDHGKGKNERSLTAPEPMLLAEVEGDTVAAASSADPNSAVLRDEPSIASVAEVLNCLTANQGDLKGEIKFLDEAGQFYRQQIGPAVFRLLLLLRKQEHAFRTSLPKVSEPTDWIIPRRCRCWVRIGPVCRNVSIATEKTQPPQEEPKGQDSVAKLQGKRGNEIGLDEPIFVLAFELALQDEDNAAFWQEQVEDEMVKWRNRFERDTATGSTESASQVSNSAAESEEFPKTENESKGTVGIIMKPFPRLHLAEIRAAKREPLATNVQLSPMKEDACIKYRSEATDQYGKTDWKDTPPSRFEVFEHNPHMSFLLSRISVYPYAFQQMPRVIGKDIMAEALDKNPDSPWFVAPMIVFREDQWKDQEKEQVTVTQGTSARQGEHLDEQNAEEDVELPESERGVNDEKLLAGYLTVDRGPGYRGWKEAATKALEEQRKGNNKKNERVEVTGDWAKFQNDLLHEMALFAACLAQRPCLRELVLPRVDNSKQQRKAQSFTA